ncbi:hypothetical protein C0J52_19025 [Blattella germanica]|nr:hypothetical protein C0J52_19025 [Blattella germanica]
MADEQKRVDETKSGNTAAAKADPEQDEELSALLNIQPNMIRYWRMINLKLRKKERDLFVALKKECHAAIDDS